MQNLDLKKKLMWENVWKNVLVVVVIAVVLPFIKNSVRILAPDSLGNFLLVISILLVTVCFANFAFTYRDSNMRSIPAQMLSHSATFLFLLLTALLLAAMTIGIGIVYPTLFSFFSIFSILLYVAVALYDFWDILRIN